MRRIQGIFSYWHPYLKRQIALISCGVTLRHFARGHIVLYLCLGVVYRPVTGEQNLIIGTDSPSVRPQSA